MKKRKLKKGRVIFVLFVLILICSAGLYFFKDVFTKDKDKPVELDKDNVINKSISMLAAGSVLVDTYIYRDAIIEKCKYDFNNIINDITLEKKDIMLYNQKSIIGGNDLGISGSPNYNSPEEMGDSILKLGFNAVSLANSISYSKGETGIDNSINYWKEKEILYSGFYDKEEREINIITKDDIKYTLLSYTTKNIDLPSNKDYLINIYDEDRVKEDVESIKDSVDVIVVSIDWGLNTDEEITQFQIDVVNYLESLGVTVIIGNGTYVQPIDIINNTIVFYSLGNLLSYQTNMEKATSLITSFDINIEIKEDVKTVTFNNINAELYYIGNESKVNFKLKPYSELTNDIQKVTYDKYYEVLRDLYETVHIIGFGD